MSEFELWMCKYAGAGEDKDGITIPWCTLNDLPCEDVLRYGDEGCKYTKSNPKHIENHGTMNLDLR